MVIVLVLFVDKKIVNSTICLMANFNNEPMSFCRKFYFYVFMWAYCENIHQFVKILKHLFLVLLSRDVFNF